MSFPYCIIDGTSYSFCTTSCIHVNLTKIALLLIEESITDSLYSGIFSFLRPAVSCRFRGAKIKPFISFHQIFREKILSGFSCWTVLTSLLTFERITLIKLLVAKFCTWISQLLPINQEENCFSKFFNDSYRSLFQHFIFIVAPSLESGCKSTWTFFSSKSYHHTPRVKLCLIADLQSLHESEARYFFIKTANSRGKETLARVS